MTNRLRAATLTSTVAARKGPTRPDLSRGRGFCCLKSRNSSGLAKFEKGQSGNPAGRPRNDQAITPLLRRLLQEKRAGKTRAEHVAATLLGMAEAGDLNAIRTVLERIDGKVLEQVDVTTAGQAFSFTIQSNHDADR